MYRSDDVLAREGRRKIQMSRNFDRITGFETFESRRVMSAQPLSDLVSAIPVDVPINDPDPQVEVGQVEVNQIVTSGWSVDDHGNQSANLNLAEHGLDGSGQTIAVIDSGIAYDHFAFGSGFGTGHRVVGGYDFAENDANPYDDGPIGLHGTHVAGIIAANSDQFAGLAPGADLVALRVFNDAGWGELEWVEQALQWVHDHRQAFENPITTVNLSLGANWQAEFAHESAELEDEFARLQADGIFVSVAAGNRFDPYDETAVSYPAASPYVIPVASHDADGQLSVFSQRNERVLVAPGEDILSTVPDHLFGGSLSNQYLRSTGTSQSAPYVAGASVLLREAFELTGKTDIDQELLYSQFRATADIVFDHATGGYFHRINLQKAVESVLQTIGDSSIDDVDVPFYHENGKLFVQGSSVDDDIQFHSGALLDINVNGTDFQLDRTGISEIVIVGGGGQDSVTATFTDAIDHAVLQTGRVDVLGPGLDLTARGFETIELHGGSRAERLIVHDSTGDDWFTAGNREVSMSGSTSFNRATGFTTITVRASGGQDRIELLGSDGDDRFISDTQRHVLRNDAGRVVAVGFEQVSIAAGAGHDIACLNDSAGDDRLDLSGHRFHMDAGMVQVWGSGFERTIAFADDGYDVVSMHGTLVEDHLLHRDGKTRLHGHAYVQLASGFDRISVWAGGGQDTARIYDTSGDDHFDALGYRTRLRAGGQTLYTQGFGVVTAYAGQGNDSAMVTGTAGEDFVTATSNRVRVESRFAAAVHLRDYQHVVVDAQGGHDSTNLVGDDRVDLLRSIENGLEFESTVQMLKIVRAENHEFSGGGGDDEIFFSDVGRLDLLQAIGDRAAVYLQDQEIQVSDFGFLQAVARAGESASYEIGAVDFLFRLEGAWRNLETE